MKRHFTKGIFTAAFAACVTAMSLHTIAATVDAMASMPQSNEPSIAGTWIGRVVNNLNNPPTTFYSLATFLPGGQIMEESSGAGIRTVAQGEWQKIGPREYIRSMVIFTFASPRAFSGVQKVVSFIQLNDDGDEYTADAFVEVFDVNGNLTTTAYNSSQGKGCTLAMSVPQCMGFID